MEVLRISVLRLRMCFQTKAAKILRLLSVLEVLQSVDTLVPQHLVSSNSKKNIKS